MDIFRLRLAFSFLLRLLSLFFRALLLRSLRLLAGSGVVEVVVDVVVVVVVEDKVEVGTSGSSRASTKAPFSQSPEYSDPSEYT